MVESDEEYERLATEVLEMVRSETADVMARGLAAIEFDPGAGDETAKISLRPTNEAAAALMVEIYGDGLMCLHVGDHAAEWEEWLDNRGELLGKARDWVRAVVSGRYRESVRRPKGARPPDLIAEVDLPDGTHDLTRGLVASLAGARGSGWESRIYAAYDPTDETA